MIIERLDLKAYGGFTDFSLDLSAGPNRFHIIVGKNESGKSTSLRAITSLLYGMPSRSVDSYLHPKQSIRVGGRLVDSHGGVLECVRRRGRKETLRDKDDDNPIDETQMQRMLGGVDQDTFLHRFGLSHDELVRGGDEIIKGGGDIGSILFAAGAGVGRLREVQTDLDKRCAELYIPRGRNGSVNQMIRDLADQKNELRDAQVPPVDFQQRKQQLEEKRAEVERLDSECKRISTEIARAESLMKSLPLIPKWNLAKQELLALETVTILDEGFSYRRRAAETDREVAKRKQADLQSRLESLQTDLKSITADSAVMIHEVEIEHLFKKMGAREEASDNQTQLQRTIEKLDRRMNEVLRQWQIDVESGDDVSVSDAIDAAIAGLEVSDAVRTRVNELSRKHESLIQQRDAAAQKVESLKQRIADLKVELADFGTLPDPDSLTQLIDSISHPSALLESLADQQADTNRAKRSCESIGRRLSGTDASVTKIASLRLPSDSAITQLTAELDQTAKAAAAAREKQDELVSQRNEIKRRLRTESSGQPLPTLIDLQQAREHRDSLLQERDKNGSSPSIAQIQAAVQKADQYVDTIRLHHEQVHRRSLDQAALDGLNEDIQANQRQIEMAIEAAESTQTQWQALWQVIGVDADTPLRMQQWVADHESLVQAFHHWEEEKSRHQEVQQRIQNTCDRLRAAVKSVALVGAGPQEENDFGGDTLFAQEDAQIEVVRLYDEAVSVRRRLVDEKAKHGELRTRLVELKQRLPGSQSQLKACQKNADDWLTDWQAATSGFGDKTDGTPTVVVEMLAQVKELASQKRERDIVKKRVRSISEDEQSYRDKVVALAKMLGSDDVDAGHPHAVVRELFQRLQNERKLATRRDLVQQQIADAKQQLSDVQQKLTHCDVMLAGLCQEAGCEQAEDLLDFERRSRQRNELAKTFQANEEQIRLLAGNIPLEDFVSKAEQQELAALEVDIESLQEQLDTTREQLNEAQREVGALQNEFQKIDGSRRAADLSQQLQMMHGDLSRDAAEYARLKIASMILRRSIEHYQNENQGPVLHHARTIFAELTCGEYQSLRVDYDAKGNLMLFGVRPGTDAMDVPASAMSTGTADSLYLAMRLASLRHQLSQGTQIPLIVDDCLVQLDNERTSAALSALSKLSAETQVILFTHHQHVVDLAAKHLQPEQFHTHRLAG